MYGLHALVSLIVDLAPVVLRFVLEPIHFLYEALVGLPGLLFAELDEFLGIFGLLYYLTKGKLCSAMHDAFILLLQFLTVALHVTHDLGPYARNFLQLLEFLASDNVNGAHVACALNIHRVVFIFVDSVLEARTVAC